MGWRQEAADEIVRQLRVEANMAAYDAKRWVSPFVRPRESSAATTAQSPRTSSAELSSEGTRKGIGLRSPGRLSSASPGDGARVSAQVGRSVDRCDGAAVEAFGSTTRPPQTGEDDSGVPTGQPLRPMARRIPPKAPTARRNHPAPSSGSTSLGQASLRYQHDHIAHDDVATSPKSTTAMCPYPPGSRNQPSDRGPGVGGVPQHGQNEDGARSG
jgi:hypothetical protein